MRTSTSPRIGRRTRFFRQKRAPPIGSCWNRGWIDAIRHLHPDERIYSFWAYWRQSFERNAGIRIDHLLLNKAATKRLKAAGVDTRPRGWEKTSDHAPAWIDLGEARRAGSGKKAKGTEDAPTE